MEKGEVPELENLEAQTYFSSLGAADNLPARYSGASQPQGSQLRQESARDCLPAVWAWEGEHHSCQTCSLRDVPQL